DDIERCSVANGLGVALGRVKGLGETRSRGGVAGLVGPRERDERDLIALDPSQSAPVSAEQPDAAAHYRVEHRLDISLRLTNDTQNVTGGGLLVQSGGKVTVARLQLLEQANVLNGDHRLIGESIQQRDLSLGKWAHIGTQNGETTQRLAFAEQWNLRTAVDRVEFQQLKRIGILALRHRLDVVDDDGPTI